MTRRKWLAALIGASVAVSAVSSEAQVIALHTGFHPDPRTLTGVAGGPIAAGSVSGECRGYVPVGPQQRVFLQTPTPFVRVWVSSQQDATLLVRAPNGQVFCADDTWGTNPGVDIQGAMRGQYEIFVGMYQQGVTAPYTLGISELRTSSPEQLPAPAAALGTRVPDGPNGVPVVGPGYVQPLTVVAPPMPVAVPVPPQDAVAGSTMLQPGFVPDPHLFSGISGGPLSAQTVDPTCRGFINTAPSHTIQLTGPENFLRFWVRSQGDTTLLVRAPTGQIFCADDTYGLNPGVDLNGAPPGSYQVFVGSYAASESLAYEMAVTELPNSTPAGGYGYVTQPGVISPPRIYGNDSNDPNNGNASGVVSLVPGFNPDPQTRNGSAGGPISAMGLNASCRGYVGGTPNHTLVLNAPFNFLRVFVQSQSDTTLLIRGPDGAVYCADDTYGFNPGVDLQGASPGVYQVFVGSYSQGDVGAPYAISFTELPGFHP